MGKPLVVCRIYIGNLRSPARNPWFNPPWFWFYYTVILLTTSYNLGLLFNSIPSLCIYTQHHLVSLTKSLICSSPQIPTPPSSLISGLFLQILTTVEISDVVRASLIPTNAVSQSLGSAVEAFKVMDISMQVKLVGITCGFLGFASTKLGGLISRKLNADLPLFKVGDLIEYKDKSGTLIAGVVKILGSENVHVAGDYGPFFVPNTDISSVRNLTHRSGGHISYSIHYEYDWKMEAYTMISILEMYVKDHKHLKDGTVSYLPSEKIQVICYVNAL